MTNADSENRSPTETAAPDGAREESLATESWLERLKAAVGLKHAPSIREDLEQAIAASDASGEGFSPEERAMLSNILRLREKRVDDVMVPRADIDAVEIGITLAELLAAFQKSGHSRMPVYRETLDDPVGLVHIKDLMGYVIRAAAVATEGGGGLPSIDLKRVDLSPPLARVDLVRNILFVPPSMPVTVLLASMQATRMQLALVIDEYGGTDGLVSLEDIIEMVVGDIEDEHDDDLAPSVVPAGEGVFLADARADLDDVAAALGTSFDAVEAGEDVDTLGGLVVSLLGRVPVRGELIALPGDFECEVLDADPRRIKRLRIYRRPVEAKPESRRRQRVPQAGSEPAG